MNTEHMSSKKLFRRLAKNKPFCDLQTPLPESNTAKSQKQMLSRKDDLFKEWNEY